MASHYKDMHYTNGNQILFTDIVFTTHERCNQESYFILFRVIKSHLETTTINNIKFIIYCVNATKQHGINPALVYVTYISTYFVSFERYKIIELLFNSCIAYYICISRFVYTMLTLTWQYVFNYNIVAWYIYYKMSGHLFAKLTMDRANLIKVWAPGELVIAAIKLMDNLEKTLKIWQFNQVFLCAVMRYIIA